MGAEVRNTKLMAGDSSTNVQDESYFDRQLTVFSTEGRLFQVEYAFNAILNCPFTSIGIRSPDGVVLISHKNIASKLLIPDSVNHIKTITERLGCTFAGHLPDCNYVHTNAIYESVKYFGKYGHGFDIIALTKCLNEINQINTQSPRMRILAAGFLLAGIEITEEGKHIPRLSKIDPAGYEINMNAFAIGKFQKDANAELEKALAVSNNIKDINSAIKVGINTLTTVLGTDLPASEIEVGICTVDNHTFRKLRESDVEEFLAQIERDDE